MAVTVDDEDYAHIVLICSGHFNDPDLQGRLTDITRQLHMLTTGTKEPLVTSVEPWNSVRVTFKVSRESAALLQTLAQQQDPKLLDIGILSVQVEGGNPVCLDRSIETSSKPSAAGDVVNADSSVCFVASSSALVGACHPAVHGLLPHTVVSTVQEATCTHASGPASSVNQSWHPLVDQRTAAAANDDSACSWDPFGYNGLSVDPFQFSADDLLTRMLADVPAPKRRQRVRKGSATSAPHVPFLLSNPVSLTAHEECSSAVQPSNELCSVTCSTMFGIPSGTQYHTPQKTGYFDNDRATVGSSQQLSSPYSTQVNDMYSIRVDKHGVLPVGSYPLYNHPQQNISSAAGGLPMSLDSLMTLSNRAVNETRSVNSDQPPVKRRHVKSRGATGSHSAVSTYGAVTEMNQQFSFRDLCNDTAKSTEMHLPPAPGSRYTVRSPRALWSDAQQSHSVFSAGYQNIDAYRFRLPYRQSCPWTPSNSSYMYSDGPVTGELPWKPYSVAGGVAARPSFTVSLPNHSSLSLNAPVRLPSYQHQPSFSTVELRHGGVSDRLMGSANYSSPSTATCSSGADQPHVSGLGNRPLPSGSHVGVVSETCSAMDYCGMAAASVQPTGIVQSTSPRDGCTGSDSDYGSASATDSGVASNTSLSVGSDHSENDRGSVEMNGVDAAISAKLSPVSAADRICTPSSPLLASSANCLLEPPCDGIATTSCGMMRVNPVSAGQNGDSCVAAGSHSGRPQNWFSDSGLSESKKSAPNARMRFVRRSRQTPTLTGERPPAITCPSLPRRLSESVKRAMRGGAATDPPMTSAPCDIGPTKVVIRITKTRCSGTGEAKRSKQKEQWCVQPIVKPFQSPSQVTSDTQNTINGALHCSATSNTKESCTDSDNISITDHFDKSPHSKDFDITSLHGAADKRDSCPSSYFTSRLTDSVVQQVDSALLTTQDEEPDADKMGCSDQDVATSAAVCHGRMYFCYLTNSVSVRALKETQSSNYSQWSGFVLSSSTTRRPFYDLKEQLESKLEILKQYAEDIALALTCNKQRYQLALDNLESISDEVHEQRRLVLPPRTPGVGAEAADDLSDWLSVSIDVVGMSYEAKEVPDSLCPSYCDSRTVPDVAADMLDKFCLADESPTSFPSRLTAEEIIKHASETAALKQLSGSLSEPGNIEAVTSTEMPCRDDEVDGAEDCRELSCERNEPVCSTEMQCDPQLKAVECTVAAESSYNVAASLSQKSVAVAALPSGVYITKPSLPNDSQATTASRESEDSDSRNVGHERRRMQLQKQFPILHDLSQRPQPS